MSDFKAKMHQIVCRRGSAPDPAGGAYSAPQTPSLDFRGPTSKGRGRDERGREGEENVGKGTGGKRGGEGGGSVAPPQAKAWPPELFSLRRRWIGKGGGSVGPPRTIFLAPALHMGLWLVPKVVTFKFSDLERRNGCYLMRYFTKFSSLLHQSGWRLPILSAKEVAKRI